MALVRCALATLLALLPSLTSIAVAAPAQPDPGAVVSSWDTDRGVPAFLWVSPTSAGDLPRTVDTAEAAARHWLGRFAPWYRLAKDDVREARVARVHDLGRGGILVRFTQQVAGLDVHGAALTVLLRRDLRAVALAGSLVPTGRARQQPPAHRLPAEAAVAQALDQHLGASGASGPVRDTGLRRAGHAYYTLAGPAGGDLLRPVRLRAVLHAGVNGLVPAYVVEVITAVAGEGPRAALLVVDAEDGQVLRYEPRTRHAANTYRVWADGTGRLTPWDGPIEDFAPHPTGVPDGSSPGYAPSTVVSVDGLNTNPDGVADPWLPAGATTTAGNNVQAYIERVPPYGFNNGDAWGTTTGAGAFEDAYDLLATPWATAAQSNAAAAQLFYTLNWLHDDYYDSGYDEAAGNAQDDTYGRGGVGGDPIIALVDGQTGVFLNNASMSTLGDGEPPFLMTGLWCASPTLIAAGQGYRAKAADFGAVAYDAAGDLVLADDGSGTASDACQALPALTGRIVLIDRGTCNFAAKAQRAEAAGAVAVLIANHTAGEGAMDMPNENPPLSITIPVVGVSQEAGVLLKAALQAGPVPTTLTKDATSWQGALDSGVVAHEFGHYLHIRQVGCTTAQCGAMSEGIGDFVAGHLIIREGDDLLGTYATGIYSIGYLPDGAYYGVRRVPYSADLAKNALMFRHVSDGEPLPDTHPIRPTGASNAEVHNAGEIWGTVMHDLYMALLGETLGATPRYTFAEARRLMTDYFVASLMLVPGDPTFLEQRDALLAVAGANDPDDLALLAAAFARRGLGTCAVGPARESQDLTGVVESFDLAPRLALVSARVDDRIASCDHDGILDATEVGVLTVTLQNVGVAPVDGAQMAVTALDPALSFPAGAIATFGALAPFATGEATLVIALDDSVTEARDVAVLIQASHDDACEGPVALEATFLVHRDEQAGATSVDDVESPSSRWTPEVALGPAGLWARVEDDTAAGNHLWRGLDHETFSDVSLVSPPVTVGADGPFGITFKHRHQFEYSNGTPFDGAVIEISADGGATWTDVSEVGDPGYGGRITTQSGNPLGGRQAYVGENAAWPDLEPVILSLGTPYLGQTVQVRFRIGTDQAQGSGGWEIDDIAFIGLAAAPFAVVGPDARACWTPVAEAGPDRAVESGTSVTLDGTGSHDPRGRSLAYQSSQIGGPAAPLEGSDTSTAGFVAPEVEDATPLRFRLAVSSDGRSATDEVEITVAPRGTLGDGGTDPHLTPGDGCGCASGGEGASGLVWILGLVWVVIRRRR